MKNRLLFLALILPILSIGSYSCTNSHEDDIILYAPKQVREITDKGTGTTPTTKITYSLTYSATGDIKTEGDDQTTGTFYYNVDGSIDSVSFKVSDAAKKKELQEAIAAGIPEAEVSVVDSLKAIYTYSASSIAVNLRTYRSKKDDNTTHQQIVLNAKQFPISYIFDETQERYSYSYTDSLLTTIEYYDHDVLQWKRSYEFNTDPEVKSPYGEVPHYVAWYFVIYRSMSPGGFVVKSTYEKAGSSPVKEYELNNFTISDLGFINQATKTYYETDGSTRSVVTYRQDYQKLVFD